MAIEHHPFHPDYQSTTNITHGSMVFAVMSSRRDIHDGMEDARLSFGEWFDDLLVAAGHNQTTFAAALGVRQTAVSNWVNNVQPPNKRNVKAISQLLGMDAADIEARIDRKSREGGLRFGRIRVTKNVAVYPVIGIVPADAMRWTEIEGGRDPVEVPRSWLKGRSPDDFFVVEVSGDCLLSHGIGDGANLFCERQKRMPRDGDIVIVRVGGEMTCKLWYWSQGDFELRDGDGAIVYRLKPTDDFHIEGFLDTIVHRLDATKP